MWTSKNFLERCEKLKEAGLAVQFNPGRRVARGFADLGFEEFYCLSGRKMASIYTGHVSELLQEHERFFFEVLGFDALVDEIVRRDVDVAGFAFESQRTWVLTLRQAESGAQQQFSHREALCCLADGLLHMMSGSQS